MDFETDWFFEFFREGLLAKRMFGGTAFYYQGKMILLKMTSPGDFEHRGKIYPFEIWNGMLFPTDRPYHAALQLQFPDLVQHPVLGKWLYLPLKTEDFDEKLEAILRNIRFGNDQWGIWPKAKSANQRPKAKSKTTKSRLINLGPITRKETATVGIKTLADLKKIGWKKALEKITKKYPNRIHTVMAYALIGAQSEENWKDLSPKKKAEARAFVTKLREKTKSRKTK